MNNAARNIFLVCDFHFAHANKFLEMEFLGLGGCAFFVLVDIAQSTPGKLY